MRASSSTPTTVEEFKAMCKAEKIGALDIRFLASVFQSDPSVTSFSGGIPGGSMTMLAQALKANSVITELDLSGCDIDDEGAHTLAEVFGVNTTICSVDVSENQIGDEGAQARVARSLSANASVKVFDISRNTLEGEGIQAFVETLKTNSGIKILLQGNQFGVDGYLAFADVAVERSDIVDTRILLNMKKR